MKLYYSHQQFLTIDIVQFFFLNNTFTLVKVFMFFVVSAIALEKNRVASSRSSSRSGGGWTHFDFFSQYICNEAVKDCHEWMARVRD